jgi:hypothetical protein
MVSVARGGLKGTGGCGRGLLIGSGGCGGRQPEGGVVDVAGGSLKGGGGGCGRGS